LNDLPDLPPIERIVDLGRLSEAGAEIVLTPSVEERALLARWVEVPSIENFTATISLKRKSLGNFHYGAKIEADLTQNCVVTLEPVIAHIDRMFSRELHLASQARHQHGGSEVLAPGAGDDEVPEELDSPRYDVAAAVLEEFSLAIDPYPRAPGAAFESTLEGEGAPENPFAVLKRLKTGV